MLKNAPNTFKYTSNSSFTTAPLCPAPAKPLSPAASSEEAIDKQRLAVEAAAQAVLDARDLEFARCAMAGQHFSLALLYNPDTMPAELVQAHAQIDRAVDAAYGYKGSKDDAARVAYLFARHSQLVALLDAQPAPKKVRTKKAAKVVF